MKRLATLAACLGVFPASLQAIDPPGPVSPPRASTRAIQSAPPTMAVPTPAVEHHPWPTEPTVPPIHMDDCGKVTGCPTIERSRTGLGGLLNPVRRLRDRGAECGSCGRVCEENFCPSCGTRLQLGNLLRRGENCGRADRSCWSKVRDWLCWRPDYSKSIPCFRPIPYQAPLIAYFPGCQEPTIPVGSGCGPDGCATKGRCDPAGCSPDVRTTRDRSGPTAFAPKGDCAAGDCGPAAGRGTRLTGLFDSIRGRKAAKSLSAGADMSEEIAPGLRFANPTFSPPPPVPQQTAKPEAPKTPVTPAGYTKPRSPQPLSARPLTNP